MKLFVTGATGFIGSHFVRLALAQGHDVVAPRRPHSVVPAGLEKVRWLSVPMDAIEPAELAGCDALVHFAAAGVSPQKASRSEMTRWNVDASLSLIERARIAGVRRFVLAGTFAEYGRSADRYNLIPPDAPLLPTSHYASSKAACFVSAYGAAVELGLELCYLRIFSAFGEGQFASNFWPALKRAALAGDDFAMTAGEQIRDYIAVEAVAKRFLHAVLRQDLVPGVPHVSNVGSGQPVAMVDFARRWWLHWNASGTLRVGDLPYRANEVMRFAPLITD
jgi:nucleoside-diphosphate-sugar epimerase